MDELMQLGGGWGLEGGSGEAEGGGGASVQSSTAGGLWAGKEG